MKNCDFCGKKASVFLTQLIDGDMKKITLCDSCAAEKGVTDPTGFSLAEMLLSGIPTSAMQAPPEPSRNPLSKKCPVCNFSLDDLQRVRRFGCAACYETFKDELEPILRNMHSGLEHKGKVPHGLQEKLQHDEMLESLQKQLADAIVQEKYESAAEIQKQMNQLNQKISAEL